MHTLIKDTANLSHRFITHRILWLLILMGALFYVMLARLFHIQIVVGPISNTPQLITTTVTQPIYAPRGNIYDRFGRPLAINIPVHVVTFNPTQTISNEALLELTELFERHNENFENHFPMTTDWPYEFTLGDSQSREFRWKDDMAIPNPETATAAESFLYLRTWFGIDEALSNADARRILNFRTMIFERRFRPQVLVLATDVSSYTIAAIMEQNDFFNGVGIELRTVRYYPQGKYFSHMLGYVGLINAEELAANPDYAHDDVIGKTGLERSMESHLRGVQGIQTVDVNPSTGRQVGIIPETVPSIPGNNVFLTIDAAMQIQTYYILKDYLTEMAIRRLQSNDPREERITYHHVFNNLLRAGWIPVRAIMEAESDSAAYDLRQYVLTHFPEATPSDRAQIIELLTDGIDSGQITPAMMFATMVDIGILSDYNAFDTRINQETATALIIEKLRIGEITPQMANIDPATGSIVVVDVHSGAVLAAVSYPSYDNNRLANGIDAEYFFRINSADPTHPMVNRPFREARAPGSTFKMVTAAAGLEHGIIAPLSTIRCRATFTRAGRPAARCIFSRGESVNVTQAIAISCNYFFFETAFRLGNTPSQRIEVLNQYMAFFGFNERTGVEIGELADDFNRDNTPNIMASPSLKNFLHLSRDPIAPSNQRGWFDGDTIRTAIGQSYNNYSAAMMARYFAQIANNGARLPLHLVDTIENHQGNIVHKSIPVPDDTGMEISSSTWTAIQNGMLQATQGAGTAARHFRDFPVQVAGKTGTAEQTGSRPSHTSFGGYAPFENPQISIYVNIPFGDTRVMPSASTLIARDIIHAFLVPEIETARPTPLNTLVR